MIKSITFSFGNNGFPVKDDLNFIFLNINIGASDAAAKTGTLAHH